MTFNLYDLKFNTRMNSTYKSTLKALKRLNFGLKAGLLSTAKSAIQRRRGGVAPRRKLHCFKPKQTTALPTYDTAKHDYVPKWNAL